MNLFAPHRFNYHLFALISITLLPLIPLKATAQTPQNIEAIEGLSDSQLSDLKALGESANDLPLDTEQSIDEEERTRTELHTTHSKDKTSTPSARTSQVWGREIFNAENLTFAPSVKIPTPVNYIVAAGDKLIISLWGEAEAEYSKVVSPEGNISIPRVGLINIGGLTIQQAEQKIKSKLSAVIAGLSYGAVELKITLGDFRSITVNIIGEADTPGTYTLPSLATAFTALYAAGGVSEIGSLRDIKLFRGGKLLTEIDIYEYLMQGGSTSDFRLEDNDLILVSPYKGLVSISGAFKRPKLYEIQPGETLSDVIEYAGGFRGDAYLDNITITRRSDGKQYSLNTIDFDDIDSFILEDKDCIEAGFISDNYANRVSIEGAVWREGEYELSENSSSVMGLIATAGGLTSDAFEGRGQIVRTLPSGFLEIIPFSISAIKDGIVSDTELYNEDKVIITSLQELSDLPMVNISGEINSPQSVVYAKGMTIEDLIVMSGGFKRSASLAKIEVARRVREPYALTDSDIQAETFIFEIDEDLSLKKNAKEFELMPYDIVFVRRSPAYMEQRIVEAIGEFNFGGEYAISKSGYRLSDLVAAAGGLSSTAYARGATLRRKYTPSDVRRAESLASLADAAKKQGTIIPNEKLPESKRVKVGEHYTLGIDLATALSDTLSSANIILKEGDRLLVPCQENTIKISGAVYYATTTTYKEGLRVKDYIKRAGGYSAKARRRPFVIEPSGNVLAVKASYKPQPGSEIVIPYKEYREPMNVQGWIGISTSIVSMAAMIMSLL